MNSSPKSSSTVDSQSEGDERSSSDKASWNRTTTGLTRLVERSARESCLGAKNTPVVSSSTASRSSDAVGRCTHTIYKPENVLIGNNNNVNHIRHQYTTNVYNINISCAGSNQAAQDGDVLMSLNDQTRVGGDRGMSQLHTLHTFSDQPTVTHCATSEQESEGLHSNVPAPCSFLPDILLQYIPRAPSGQKSGVTPLHLACQNGHDKIVNKLLGRGANANARDSDGWTPLHLACQNGHLQAVKLLVNHGADVDISSASGVTPMHLACQNGHDIIVDFLLDNEARVNVETAA